MSGVYLYFRILMYVKRHEQFEIGCGAILNKISSISLNEDITWNIYAVIVLFNMDLLNN